MRSRIRHAGSESSLGAAAAIRFDLIPRKLRPHPSPAHAALPQYREKPGWQVLNHREQERGESAGETTKRTRNETNPNSTPHIEGPNSREPLRGSRALAGFSGAGRGGAGSLGEVRLGR